LLGLGDMSKVSLAKVETILSNSLPPIIEENEYKTIKWIIAAVRAGIDIIGGDRSKGVADGFALLQDKSKANNYVYGLLSHFIGVGLENLGLLSKALEVYETARNYGLTHNFFYGYFHSSVAMAHVILKQGRLNKAKEEFNNALGFAIELNLENATVSLTQTGLMEIALQQNNLAVIDSLANEILANFDKTIFSESVQVNHIERCVFLANYFVNRNDLKNARDFFDRALISHRDYSAAGSALPYDIVDTYLRIIRAEARKNGVKEWYTLASDFLDPVSLNTPEGRIMQASIYINQGTYSAAKDLLSNLVEELRQSEYGGHLAQALVLYALALHATSDKETAFIILEEVLQTGSSSGFVRVFLEEGEPMKSMICEYFKLDRSRAFELRNPGFLANLTRMLDLECSQKKDKTISTEPVMTSLHLLQEPLSERESEVLNMLLVGRSAKEIAELLMVSINTTKTHIKSIYRKFDVHSQKMLIERTADLGYKV
jgi:LuxR family maltose regulon positive regulatory protein